MTDVKPPAPLSEQIFRRFQRWTIGLTEANAADFWNDDEWLRKLTNAAPVSETAPSEGAARLELENIVNAKRFDRKVFSDDTEFADWAQSRARHTLKNAAPQVPAYSASGVPVSGPAESAPAALPGCQRYLTDVATPNGTIDYPSRWVMKEFAEIGGKLWETSGYYRASEIDNVAAATSIPVRRCGER